MKRQHADLEAPSDVNMASHSLVHAGLLLAIVLFADFLGAVPLQQHKEAEAPAGSDDVKAQVMSNLKKLVRHRRNVPVMAVPQFKRLPDFWGWYKYFMDSHNQEGVEDLDRLYMAYLQNKHRSEEGPTFNHYLKHLSEIYKACADSDDPECIAESTSKPKAAVVMPAPIKSAAVRMCNPYIDPYCLFPVAPKAAAPEPAPAKAPAPILTPMPPMPLKSPAGFYYTPVLESFLSHEQRAELLRICNHDDIECLQYHLRAAYGYRPAAGPAPSYSALRCDPKDPYCMPVMVQKAPTGFYHLLYPSCDPIVDPLCVGNVAAPAALGADSGAPQEQHCNPLFDAGCNPLTATKLSALTKPVLEYAPKDQPAHVAAPLACDPRYDPYCILAAAAALRKTQPQLPEHQVRYKLGIRGRTKEGYDCYVHYDKDCTPLESYAKAKADIQAPAEPLCHPFDPTCAKFVAPPAVRAQKAATGGIIFPDPDCDPEFDYNCRLRRADEMVTDEPAKEATKTGVRFEDFLRGFMGQHKSM
ncbi:actinodin2 isoform X3 [Dunckerocampus dactyliophorus]|uniref:actinodin2 isoform X3 n=1 Tax=Dunckerocampus dactyliophorus TaxID=161453 RepID=UPI00240714AD|nr:actinodin2 isoform X3 [Dunckerocampus dactyliophorus]